MGLNCARMSCGQPASASLIFDAEGSRVVIIDLADATQGIPVCRSHARTRTAPVGWTMDDQRTVDQPSLWADAAPTQERRGTGRRVPMIDRPAATIAPDQHGPDERPPARRPDDGSAPFAWGRDEGSEASIDEPAGPLLSRAFRPLN